MLIITTGDGKGKTTGAIGQAIRAVGAGKNVFFAQFIKCDGYPSGEDTLLRSLPGVTFVKGGKGFVGILGDTLPREEHARAARATLDEARAAAVSRGFDLVILDEANVAMSLGLLSRAEVMEFLRNVPKTCDVVMTGRGADPTLVEYADMVTECREIKHPFHQNVPARKGIEY